MRLRLTVQRHGLPPVQLLWTAGHVLPPPYAALGNSITVSQFVEQVNDIIPLEADDWGLEDYAVEVRGFECLHFSEVGQVLKEDDEVCIRPLQTSDLRVRKITGRHQISTDGKHLIDGVAFGRPFLRKADRPAIRIPPRKRRRLNYDDEEDVNNEVSDDRQIVVRAGFEDADEATAGDGCDDEEDFNPDDEENEDLDAELASLQASLNDRADEEGAVIVGNIKDGSTRNIRTRKSPKGLGLLQLLDENGQPFTGNYHNPLLDEYGQYEPPHQQAAAEVGKRGTAFSAQRNHQKDLRGAQGSSASLERITRHSSTGSNKSVRFENEPATPATVREFEDSDEEDDMDFEPADNDESDKENAEPYANDSDTSDQLSGSSTPSSSSFSELRPSDSDDTSSSGSTSSDSDSSSDYGPEQRTSKRTKRDSNSSWASSSSSGSSDSESSAEAELAPTSKLEAQGAEDRKTSQKRQWALGNVTASSPKKTTGAVHSSSPPRAVAPGKGTKKTWSRNKRRRESKRLAFLKAKGLLPANASKADYPKFMESNQPGTTDGHKSPQQLEEKDADSSIAFEAERPALLASIASGGIYVGPFATRQEQAQLSLSRMDGQAQDVDVRSAPKQPEGQTQPSKTDTQARGNDEAVALLAPSPAASEHDEPMKEAPAGAEEAEVTAEEGVPEESSTVMPLSRIAEVAKQTPTSLPQIRRSRLDVSSAKRMLFGSLGFRTPKSKEDESNMQQKLMKDLKPLKQPHNYEEAETADDIAAAAADDSWKYKVDLRAVECCYDGVKLSTPPFPFVQRWDPQQQGGYNYSRGKKRKGKKRKRNYSSYYEEGFNETSQNNTARQTEYQTSGYELEKNGPVENVNADVKDREQQCLDDESFQDSIKVREQLQRETEADISEKTLVEPDGDLPPLPEDMSICPNLTAETATTGTIIAFKQFVMSAATNWQPTISNYRTAIIKEVMDDGVLHMALAKRDQSAKEIHYDDETGERVLGRFEMEGYEDETQSAGGVIKIPFEELIDPLWVPIVDNDNAQNPERHGQSESQGATQRNPGDNDQNQEQLSGNQSESSDTATLKGAHDKATLRLAGLDGAADEGIEENPVEPSNEIRQEMSALFRDAGWESSIASVVNGTLGGHQDDPALEEAGSKNDIAPTDTPSSKLHVFSSSPPFNAIHVASSPLPADTQVTKQEHASGFEVADSFRPLDHENSDAPSMTSAMKLTIDYPNLPQVGDESYVPQGDDDSDLFENEAQHRSNPIGLDSTSLSQDNSSLNGVDPPPAQSTRSRTHPSQESHSPNIPETLDHSDSDNEFPPLFSQAFEARMSQEIDIKPELFSSQQSVISPPARRRSKPNSQPNSSQREYNREWNPEGEWSGFEDEDADKGGSTPRASQPPASSLIIDLTQSSDSPNPPHTVYSDDDDDSYVLPKGPGWVKKSRASYSGPRNVPAKAHSRRRKTTNR